MKQYKPSTVWLLTSNFAIYWTPQGSPRRRKPRTLMITADERLAAAAEGEALSIDETRLFYCAVAAQPKAVAAGRRR
jgi:hypothetical protein